VLAGDRQGGVRSAANSFPAGSIWASGVMGAGRRFMNGSKPDTKLSPLKRLKPWIVAAGWASWLIGCAVTILTPDSLPIPFLLLAAVVVLGLITFGSITLALAYRHFLATWLGIAGLMLGVGLTVVGASRASEWGAFAGIISLAQISFLIAYVVSVAAFVKNRDISVALFGGLLLIGVWAAALGVAHYRGPANFLLAYFREAESGGFWWWNMLTTAFCCALPVMAVGFWVHLLRLGWREWKRG